MISINIDRQLHEKEWGFYVDIENQDTITLDEYKIMRENDIRLMNCLQCTCKLVSVIITTTFITILTYLVFCVI